MTIPIFSNGKEYVSAARAGELVGYSSDYVGQLSRAGKIPSKLIGRTWYVELESLFKHRETRQLGKPRTYKNIASSFENTFEGNVSLNLAADISDQVKENNFNSNYKYTSRGLETMPALAKTNESVRGGVDEGSLLPNFALATIALIATVITGITVMEQTMPNLAVSVETRLEEIVWSGENNIVRSLVSNSWGGLETIWRGEEGSKNRLEIRLTQEEIRALLLGKEQTNSYE